LGYVSTDYDCWLHFADNGHPNREVASMTFILKMLVFLLSIFSFAAFALWRDKKEHLKKEVDARQAEFNFQNHKNDSSNLDQRGAAMSRTVLHPE
jgi:hypothetical protein